MVSTLLSVVGRVVSGRLRRMAKMPLWHYGECPCDTRRRVRVGVCPCDTSYGVDRRQGMQQSRRTGVGVCPCDTS